MYKQAGNSVFILVVGRIAEKILNALAGKEIKKTIVANSKAGKMVNFVI